MCLVLLRHILFLPIHILGLVMHVLGVHYRPKMCTTRPKMCKGSLHLFLKKDEIKPRANKEEKKQAVLLYCLQ
jgi:hypothetical protein